VQVPEPGALYVASGRVSAVAVTILGRLPRILGVSGAESHRSPTKTLSRSCTATFQSGTL
jgi:hypothetical protein